MPEIRVPGWSERYEFYSSQDHDSQKAYDEASCYIDGYRQALRDVVERHGELFKQSDGNLHVSAADVVLEVTKALEDAK